MKKHRQPIRDHYGQKGLDARILEAYERAGSASPPYFPLPWASDESICLLPGPDELRGMLDGAGFEEVLWRDITDVSLEWFRGAVTAIKTRKADTPKLGLNLIMGPNAADKSKNIGRNLEEDRIRVIQGVFRRGE
jgi:hypothetical protein